MFDGPQFERRDPSRDHVRRADLDAAAAGIVASSFGFSGQKCSACSRAIVLDSVHDELVERLCALASGLAVGDPADRDAFTGPVVDERAVARFTDAVQEAGRDGKVAAGGQQLGLPGHFVAPTTPSPRGRHDRRVAGIPVVLRLEEQRLDRQGRTRAVLRAAVHARAEPDRRACLI